MKKIVQVRDSDFRQLSDPCFAPDMLKQITWGIFDDNLCGEFGFFHHPDFLDQSGYNYLIEKLDKDTIAVTFFYFIHLQLTS